MKIFLAISFLLLSIKLHNSLGKEIDTIGKGFFEAGSHSKLYQANPSLPGGIYFYQITTENFKQTNKMIKLK